MPQKAYQLTLMDNVAHPVRQVITTGLTQYSREMAGYYDARDLSVLVLRPTQEKSDRVDGTAAKMPVVSAGTTKPIPSLMSSCPGRMAK